MNGETIIIAQCLGLGQVAIADALDFVIDDPPGFSQRDLAIENALTTTSPCRALAQRMPIPVT